LWSSTELLALEQSTLLGYSQVELGTCKDSTSAHSQKSMQEFPIAFNREMLSQQHNNTL